MLNILYRMCIPIDRTVNQYRKCILVDRNCDPVSAAGRRGVPLQHKAHDEGTTDWGPPGVAPGLWVI